jgi:hypothetical protein
MLPLLATWGAASYGVPALASRKCQRIPPTGEWQHLTLLTETPGQRSYEQQSFH